MKNKPPEKSEFEIELKSLFDDYENVEISVSDWERTRQQFVEKWGTNQNVKAVFDFVKTIEDMPPDIQKVIEEGFWDLL